MLNMGQQVRILDLAEDLIRLSGLEPHRRYRESLLRVFVPGEKLREDLWEDGVKIRNRPAIRRSTRAADEEQVDDIQLAAVIERLAQLAQQSEAEGLVRVLNDFLPSGSVRSTPPPDMTSLV